MNEIIKNDEIDLREVLRSLKKRKLFIILFVAICAVATALFTAFRPPTYTATATLKIMWDARGYEDFMSSTVVMDEIRQKAGDKAVDSSKFKAEVNNLEQALIFSVVSPDPSTAVDTARLWAESYPQVYINLEKEKIENIKNKIQAMKKELENYPKYREYREIKPSALEYYRDGVKQYASVVLEMHPFYRAFEDEIAKEKVKLSYIRIEVDHFAGQLNTPVAVSQAKQTHRPLLRNIILTAVLSFFAAVVLVLIYEGPKNRE